MGVAGVAELGELARRRTFLPLDPLQPGGTHHLGDRHRPRGIVCGDDPSVDEGDVVRVGIAEWCAIHAADMPEETLAHLLAGQMHRGTGRSRGP